MARRPGSYELLVGATVDAVFGPIMVFGQGGIAVDLLGDHAMALPPLNMKLAKDLIHATRIASLLQGFRTNPAVDLEAICLTLIQISHLVQDFPEIVELDINPLLADQKGVLALDARMKIAPSRMSGPHHLAIRPYPQELEEWITLRSGERVFCRPIRPEGEHAHNEFFPDYRPRIFDSGFLDSSRSCHILKWPVSRKLTMIGKWHSLRFELLKRDVLKHLEWFGPSTMPTIKPRNLPLLCGLI
jgi:acetyltransferase